MIVFAWREFPQYAARCVGAFVSSVTGRNVIVVATRPKVPISGMDSCTKCRIVWIDENEPRALSKIVDGQVSHFIVSGWGTPLFNRFRDEVRRAGGNTYAMIDNDYRFSWREVVKAIRFRLCLRSKYRAFFFFF